MIHAVKVSVHKALTLTHKYWYWLKEPEGSLNASNTTDNFNHCCEEETRY